MPRSQVPNADAIQFGAIIKRLRNQRGWTLADLARASSMNATYLGVIERGENLPSLTSLFRLSNVFGIPAAEIICEMEGARHGALPRDR